MKKLLSCREIGRECNYIATEETEEEVLRHTTKYSIEKHGFIKIGEYSFLETKIKIISV